MNTKILSLLAIFGLLVATVPAMAVSDENPKGFTVSFNTIVYDTSFSVLTKTDQLNFSSLANVAGVSPEGGNPWGNITNDGDVALNFSVKLDSLPANIDLKIGSQDSDLISVGITATSPAGWTNVPFAAGSDKVDIVAKADYGASSGTQSKTITVESAKSS